MLQLIYGVTLLSVFMAISQGDNMIGPGVWNVLSISKQEQNEAVQTFNFDIVKRKLNRTHDAYNASCNFDEDFDYTFALHVEICKRVDGGCKQYQVISEQSLGNFLEQHAKRNVELFLENGGIDPPKFPIKAGQHEVKNFVIDYCSLPPESPYGVYEATVQILKASNCVGAIIATVEFTEDDDNVCGNGDES